MIPAMKNPRKSFDFEAYPEQYRRNLLKEEDFSDTLICGQD
jgi:hypothetical protein